LNQRVTAFKAGGAFLYTDAAGLVLCFRHNAPMTDDQLLRYSRHILLEEIGVEGQERLLAAHALVIGAGGLGSPVALYLGTAGVGRITLVDHDTVDLTNLQRQLAHTMARLGMPKAESARQAIAAINPEPQVRAIAARADAASLDPWVGEADVVIDCCDNFATRHAVNAACVKHVKPLVSGAAIRFDGQITVYDTRDDTSPCYACLFAPSDELEETRCATMGVFAPLVGIIGAMQAAEALKLLSRAGTSLAGRLLMLDGRAMDWNEVRVPRNPACPVCASRATHSQASGRTAGRA
jgi:molybdopterin/thiamine biosynthesis adenylyltransferase